MRASVNKRGQQIACRSRQQGCEQGQSSTQPAPQRGEKHDERHRVACDMHEIRVQGERGHDPPPLPVHDQTSDTAAHAKPTARIGAIARPRHPEYCRDGHCCGQPDVRRPVVRCLRLARRLFAGFPVGGIKRSQRSGHARWRHQHGPALFGQAHPVGNAYGFQDEIPRLRLLATGRHAHGSFGRNLSGHPAIVATEPCLCRVARTCQTTSGRFRKDE